MSNKKLIVIVGPTASGKSALAVAIAKKIGGEVISADSRQIYKRLNIGTGKITKKEMAGIPHHLLDIAHPKRTFTVAHYKKLARKKIEEIWRRGKIPILCGGTGLYIQAVVDGLVIPEVKPNQALRKRLEKLSADKLYGILHKKDPQRAKNIERKNKRRLIRAIEIAEKIGMVPLKKFEPLNANAIFIGLRREKEELNKLIEKRLAKRLAGIIREIKKLASSGVSFRRLENLGLEYRWGAKFVKKEITKEEFFSQLLIAIKQYAKRQLTWFRHDPRVSWVTNGKEALKIARGI